MFASLSSFLPSALQQLPQPPRPPSPPQPQHTLPADPPRKKEKKEKHPNEAFIIVRPPPKSTQPLSLQLQLVPPQSRHDRPLQALDHSPDDFAADLKRTHSTRSESSATSDYTSVGSVSSIASTSTTGSGRRTIIPLYNLNVHSVLPTTILDAGTDAKVAKFVRRGLEVFGLAFLEPIEVHLAASPRVSFPPSVNVRASLDDSALKFGPLPSPHSPPSYRPRSSHAVVNTADSLNPTMLASPLPPPDRQPQRPTKKLLSRVFKKKDPASPPSISLSSPDDIASHPSPLRSNGTRSSGDAPISQLDASHHRDAWSFIPPAATTTSQSAFLGVHPTLYPPVSNTKGRPIKYVWLVRKWLKGADTGIINGMMGKLNAGARDTGALNTPHIEVRFEWSRERKKGNSRKSRANKSSNPRKSSSPAGAPSSPLPRVASHAPTPDARSHRISVISHNSSGSETGVSLASCGAHHAEETDEESDPEDSETPWTCALAVQRLGHPNGAQESCIRVKVATLAPTPHHPKVVGLLKIPFPLPDIEVEQLAVRRRHVTPQGVSRTISSRAGEFVLSAEEIKDTVSSTALWLVVREAFGGVGSERRKGKS